MLPMPRHSRPLEPGCAWPDVMQSFHDVMAVSGDDETAEQARGRRDEMAAALNRVRLVAPPGAITQLDEVLGWLMAIEMPRHRRTVFARMLIHPVSLKNIYSWSVIAKTLGSNKRTVRRWYDAGLDTIINNLPRTPP